MNFSRAHKTYRENAIVQKNMAKKLVELILSKCGKSHQKIFEIGCGTGFLTENLNNNLDFNKIILNDLTQNYSGFDFEFICGDANAIEFPKSCDLIVSNAVFQWIVDVEKLFLKIKNNLENDGILAFSSFGERNFEQFKKVFNSGLNYPNYVEILKLNGWEILTYEEEITTLYFKSFREILEHVKNTGVALQNSIRWNKGMYLDFERNYLENYSDDNGVELTYHPLWIVAKPR